MTSNVPDSDCGGSSTSCTSADFERLRKRREHRLLHYHHHYPHPNNMHVLAIDSPPLTPISSPRPQTRSDPAAPDSSPRGSPSPSESEQEQEQESEPEPGGAGVEAEAEPQPSERRFRPRKPRQLNPYTIETFQYINALERTDWQDAVLRRIPPSHHHHSTQDDDHDDDDESEPGPDRTTSHFSLKRTRPRATSEGTRCFFFCVQSFEA